MKICLKKMKIGILLECIKLIQQNKKKFQRNKKRNFSKKLYEHNQMNNYQKKMILKKKKIKNIMDMLKRRNKFMKK